MNRYIKGRISKGEFVSELFKQRVESLGGTYEANDCLVKSLNSLTDREFKDAKAILTPNGYLVDKLPTIKPNGGGDATIVRNVVKTRVNSSGLIESMAVNVLAPDYLNGVCPSLNVEGQATNLVLESDGELSTYELTTPDTINAVVPILNFNNSIFFQSNNVQDAVLSKRDFRAIAGVDYVVTFFVEMLDGSVPNPGSLPTDSNLDFSIIIDNEVATSHTVTRVKNTNSFKVSGTANANVGSTIFGIRRFSGQSQKNFKVTGMNLSEGTEPTSYIPTTTAAVTRSADTVTVPIPAGTTEIIKKYEDGTTNTITTIPASTYTVPTGKRYEYILMR